MPGQAPEAEVTDDDVIYAETYEGAASNNTSHPVHHYVNYAHRYTENGILLPVSSTHPATAAGVEAVYDVRSGSEYQVYDTGSGGNPQTAVLPASHHTSLHHHHPQSSRARAPKRKRVITFDQRKAANIRERRRMLSLNDAFNLLRRTLPTFSYEKKLSRIETLRLALTYIAFMTDVLNGADPKEVRLLSARPSHTIYRPQPPLEAAVTGSGPHNSTYMYYM